MSLNLIGNCDTVLRLVQSEVWDEEEVVWEEEEIEGLL